MLGIFEFLASPAGRWTRAIAGLVIVAAGLWFLGGTAGYVVAVIGLVPLAAGLFDFCVFAPLAGLPFSGRALRDEIKRRTQAHVHA